MDRIDRINEYTPNYTVHPGEYILEFIETAKLKKEDFAENIGISSERLEEIITGKASIDESIANAMTIYGYSPKYWLSMQSGYEKDIKELAEKHIQKKLKFGKNPHIKKHFMPDGRAVQK